MLTSWPAPGGGEEYALRIGDGGPICVLVLPAWFDESNKMRHFTVETMRALNRRGICSVLPDMPGSNESTTPLDQHNLQSWAAAASCAATHFKATHVLTIRAGANITPDLPGWSYAPLAGKSSLRALLRARIITAKEAGREEKRDALLEEGKAAGLELAGHRLSAEMIAGLSQAELSPCENLKEIPQAELGGAGLWLRMEPDHDQQQAERLAEHIAADCNR